MGRKAVKWVPLVQGPNQEPVRTPAQAAEELHRLVLERSENRLRHIGQTPQFTDYLTTYIARLPHSGKKPDTIITETTHYERWRKAIGSVRLDKIRAHHITAELHRLKASGRSARTCNLALVCLRSALKAARTDGYIKTLPVEGVPWLRTDKKSRRLYTNADIDLFLSAVPGSTKNAAQFTDYIRFLQYTGAREKEALRVRWQDVDLDKAFVTIGAEGDSKNRQARHVDFNDKLETLLRDMHARRAPDSQWVFPSPQRGDKDIPSKSFRESLLLVRSASGCVCSECKKLTAGESVAKCAHCGSEKVEKKSPVLPPELQKFAFHDLRHHFISYAVMSAVDFMTVAAWVGHKDGGVLIGKVYGHLADEHKKQQARKLTFEPVVLASQNVVKP